MDWYPRFFLAMCCVNSIADKTTNSKLKEIIKNDFCVDDCLTREDALTEAIMVRNELISIMESAGFELSKWTANHEDLIPNPNKSKLMKISMDRRKVKALALYWEPESDYYTYVVQIPNMLYNTLWWHGPIWLNNNEFKCPTVYIEDLGRVVDIKIEKKITPIIACTTTVSASFTIDKYSSLNKLSHVVAYLLRYKRNSLSKHNNTP